jgi:surface carbohydrate biosynthesis protein
MRILLLIDQKWRDLPGHVLLKRVLEVGFGHRVLAGPIGSEGWLVPLFRPDVVVVNHLLESAKVRLARALRGCGVGVVALPTEGIPALADVRLLAAGKYTDMSLVDLQLCWNWPMRDLIVDEKILPPDRVQVIGVPRFDVYRGPASRLVAAPEVVKRRYRLDPERPVVLLTSNFVNAGFIEERMDFLEANSRDLGLDRVASYARPAENARRDHRTRELALAAMTRLLEDLPAIAVAVKPHPNENQRAYRRWLASVESRWPGRVALIEAEYIWDTLGIASILVQRSCTTAVEAWFRGLPTLEFRLNPEEYYHSAEHAAGSEPVETYEKLRASVWAYIHDRTLPPALQRAREAFIDRWVGPLDGRRTLACAAAIDQFANGRFAARRIRFDRFWLRSLLRGVAKEVVYHPLRRVGDRARNSVGRVPLDFLGRAEKRITFADVQLWVRRIDQLGIVADMTGAVAPKSVIRPKDAPAGAGGGPRR